MQARNINSTNWMCLFVLYLQLLNCVCSAITVSWIKIFIRNICGSKPTGILPQQTTTNHPATTIIPQPQQKWTFPKIPCYITLATTATTKWTFPQSTTSQLHHFSQADKLTRALPSWSRTTSRDEPTNRDDYLIFTICSLSEVIWLSANPRPIDSPHPKYPE